MWMPNGWKLMLHFGVFVRYASENINNKVKQGAASQLSVPNWEMFAANHKVGKKGLFSFRIMFSLDPITVGGQGYPLLFQTGESWHGKALVDRQHPHDLLSELSLAYSYAITKNSDAYVYAGLPGEPALGSPAFMHRPSSLDIPDAPIAHHWQDGTHITFGVVTFGYRYKNIKIEASDFTGREPDENRYNIDMPKFDSYSFKLSANISNSLALAASYGIVHSPEALEPNVNVARTTFSALHNIAFLKKPFCRPRLFGG